VRATRQSCACRGIDQLGSGQLDQDRTIVERRLGDHPLRQHVEDPAKLSSGLDPQLGP